MRGRFECGELPSGIATPTASWIARSFVHERRQDRRPSLLDLGLTAAAQAVVFVLSGSVTLLADPLAVVASADVIALSARIADRLLGLLITIVILKITWDSWRVVSRTDPGEHGQ